MKKHKSSTMNKTKLSHFVAKVIFVFVIATLNSTLRKVPSISSPSQGLTKASFQQASCAAVVVDSWIPSDSTSKPCVELPQESTKLACLKEPPNFDGYWTVEHVHNNTSQKVSSWHWHQTTTSVKKNQDATKSVISVPDVAPFHQYSLGSLLSSISNNNDRNTAAPSVVFYGSSHIRELYFAMIRLARGQSYDAPLELHVMRVGSFPFGYKETDACGKSPADFDKRRGIDLEACGEPGKRLVPELSSSSSSSWDNNNNNSNNNSNSNVAIGFKTFLHTPDADDIFLEFLTAKNLRHPTVLIVDVGIWGSRGSKMSDINNPRFQRTHRILQPQEEVEYYLQWISSNFPHTNIVYVYERGYNPIGDLEPLILTRIHDIIDNQRRRRLLLRKDNQHQPPLSWIIRKDLIQGSRPKAIMPCAHGCAGPVTMVIATMILDWIEEVLTCRQVVGATAFSG
jgi:hypothetical protein